jgi:hypothetical protein
MAKRKTKPKAKPEGADESVFGLISTPKKRAFLVAYVTVGAVHRTAAVARVSWQSHYNWLKADPHYAAAFELAKKLAADYAEGEVYRRGVLGTDHPIIYQGQITGHYTEYSDTCLLAYLNANREEYRKGFKGEVSVNHSGDVKQTHVFDYGEFERLNGEINRRIAEGLASAGNGTAQGNGSRKPLNQNA